MSEQSLREKTVKGTFWSAVDNVSSYIVTFVVGVVLARLLSPDDYGLIGIIGIFSSVCDALINGGFGTALIRKKDSTPDDFNTAFFVNMTMSVIMYMILFLCAPLIARFFARDELALLIRVTNVSMIIGAFSMVQGTKLTKRIDFKSQTKVSLTASLTSGVVGISMAYIGCGVWALVVQGIVRQIVNTIMLLIINRWLPAFRFCRKSFEELFGFGWKLMLSRLIDNVWGQLTNVVVGKFYNPNTLGQYSRAQGFSGLFSSNLTSVIQRVSFPVLCNIQNERERMVEAYRRIIKLTMYVSFIGMFGVGAISEPMIYCLIGSKWNEAAQYLPLICLTGSLYPLHAINLNMLQVQGRSDIFLILEIIKKIIGLGPLFIGAFIGIMPMLYVSFFTSILCFFLNSFYTGKSLGYTSWMQIKDVLPSFVIAAVMASVVYSLKYLPVSYWVVLPLQLVIGAAVAILISRWSRNNEYMAIMSLVSPYIKKILRIGIKE